MLYPVMMSGSTVLKNSAQLCSQKRKQKLKDVIDDQETGKEENMSEYFLFFSASLKPMCIPAVAVSPVWSTVSVSPQCWHRPGEWTRCEWRAPSHPAAAPSTLSESQGLCLLLGRFLDRKELAPQSNSALAFHQVWSGLVENKWWGNKMSGVQW